LLKVSVEIS